MFKDEKIRPAVIGFKKGVGVDKKHWTKKYKQLKKMETETIEISFCKRFGFGEKTRD